MRARSFQSCPTLCDPMDCSQPGSSVPGIVQARIPEWGAMPPKGVYKMALNNTEPHSETMIMVFTIFHAIWLYQTDGGIVTNLAIPLTMKELVSGNCICYWATVCSWNLIMLIYCFNSCFYGMCYLLGSESISCWDVSNSLQPHGL